MIPVANATLTLVAGGGTSEDFGAAAGADTTRWQGTDRAYLSERILTEMSAGKVDEARQAILTVRGSIPVVAGDTVTYRYEGASSSRDVRDIERDPVIGITRLYLSVG